AVFFFDSHEIPERRPSHACSLLGLSPTFSLLASLFHDSTALPAEHGHVALVISHSWYGLQLFGEDGSPVEKRGPEIMDQQMDSCRLLFLKIPTHISPLGHSGDQHSVGLPCIVLFLPLLF